MPLTPDQLTQIIERRDAADQALRQLADAFALAQLPVEGSTVEVLRVTLSQNIADALHKHVAGGQFVADPNAALPKGTTVRMKTTNGGNTEVVLVNDYIPGRDVVVATHLGRSYTVERERIASIEAVR